MALLSLCCSTLYALKCYVSYTTTLSNLLYSWWMARVLLLPWYSFGRRPQGCLSLITRTTPAKQHTCLQLSVAKWVDWNCLTSGESFINAQSRLQPAGPSEDLPLMGREESEVWFTSCKQFVNTPLSFYSTFGADLPTTSECSFDAKSSLYFGGMQPRSHRIDGVETLAAIPPKNAVTAHCCPINGAPVLH